LKYTLVYTQRAIKDINRLPTAIKNRIGDTLNRYRQPPLNYAEKLKDPKLGSYRFRIGDFRVIFDLEDEEIVVLRVGHRSEIYREL